MRALRIAAALACAAFACAAQPGKLVDVGGYRVHLYCTGKGSPAVVIAGGFSVDWGLVQPEIARRTRVCTYDPSGTAWSDPFPGGSPKCSDRVAELHAALQAAGIGAPYVLVGFSIGGLYARLFAERHGDEVAGVVIVDHAFLPPKPRQRTVYAADQVDTPPVLISQTPIAIGVEDDANFQRLPAGDRELHAWAERHSPLRPTPEMAAECEAEVGNATLGSRPLVVIRTNNASDGYDELQQRLMALSRNSTLITAEHSSHMVIVDEPEVIVNAVGQVLATVRK